MLDLKNQKVVLFGAGYFGEKILDILTELDVTVSSLIDNNEKKQGQQLNGVLIRSPQEQIKEDRDCCFIISAVDYSGCLSKQLLELGVDNNNIVTLEDFFVSETIHNLIDDKFKDDFEVVRGKNHPIIPDHSMSILFDGQVFSFQRHGGISRYIYELSKGLARIDQTYVSLFRGINISDIALDERVNNVFDKKSEYAVTAETRLRDYLNERLFCEYCKKSRFSIYHPTYYGDYGVCNYKKKIITVHDMIHELFNMDVKTIIEKKQMVESADGIIAVSNNTKKDIMDILGIPENRIRVIYHGNSLNISVQGDRIIKEPYILYVGERGGYKNAESLIKAYANCRFREDIRMVFFGGGEFSKTEFELLERLSITDKVYHLRGSDIDLANLYTYADVFVYPSKYEGFGIPLLEAMHYGVPVITANISSMPEVAGDAAEFFSPDSVEDLKNKIEYLLSDTNRREQLSKNGIQREKMFSWTRCAEETYEYYSEVLNS